LPSRGKKGGGKGGKEKSGIDHRYHYFPLLKGVAVCRELEHAEKGEGKKERT